MSKKKLNENFFKSITEESAYVLGFMYGDCSLYDRRICFTNKDEHTIMQIRDAAGSGHKITPTAGIYRMIWTSKEVYASLGQYGVIDGRFPDNIPPEYMSHFIRGFFDSGGHFCYDNYHKDSWRLTTRFLFSNREFLERVQLELQRLGIEKLPKIHLYGKTYVMIYYAKDTRRIYDILYRDATIYTRWRRQYAHDHLFTAEREQGEDNGQG